MKSRLAILLLLTAPLAAQAAAPGSDFAPCADAAADPRLAGSLCAHFPAPDGKGSLFLREFPAANRSLGQVWLVAGESGAALLPAIAGMRQAFPGYDLILPDRRASGLAAAKDLRAEIDRYSTGGATLLYGATQGSEVVLKTLPLVRPRRVEAVILDSPPAIAVTTPGPAAAEQAQPVEPALNTAPPRTLVLQGDTDAAPLPEIEKNAPVTTYTIEGAPSFLMMTVPECAAPLVHDFVEGAAAGGAPCAARLSIRF